MSATWQEQIRNSPRTIKAIEHYFRLSDEEKSAILSIDSSGGLPFRVTPHYLSLIDPLNPEDPLRKQVIPNQTEFKPIDLERRDPLGEEDHEAVPHLVHRYPDRVLLLITDRCAAYCRFCTRKRWVGQGPTPKPEHLEQALDYIAADPNIKEVILSGGDSLLLDDKKLDQILSRIRKIQSVEIIRLATRMLAFAPTRITDSLIEILKQNQPVYILSHFNHIHEISAETELSILKLIDNGLPILNQTVLLKGVNDDRDSLARLFRKLTYLRTRPYYLHQCDLAPGTEQFRVPIEEALGLVESLRGHISGLCLPTFVIDIPGGFGKVPLFPNPIVSQNSDSIRLKGFLGEQADYPLK